jgi:hypothetical protein
LKNDFIEFLDNARKRRPEKFRHQFSIFLTCLGISIFLWLLVQLSKEYSYNVEYRLRFTEIPSSLRLTRYSDSSITVTIRIQGYEFFSDRFLRNRLRTVDVSLRTIKIKPFEDGFNGFLLTRNISRGIAAESKYPLDIYSASPDTIYFSFGKKNLKKFPPLKPGQVTVTSRGDKEDSERKKKDSLRILTPLDHQKQNKKNK